MISSNAAKNADNCRFCWMCRHLCPVGLKTGKEINTPRAKALLLSMAERGMKFDAGMALTMYECVLCGACTNDCVTGFNPSTYIREARSIAAANDLLPPGVKAVLSNIEKTGNIYGMKKPVLGANNAGAGLKVTNAAAGLPFANKAGAGEPAAKGTEVVLYIGEVAPLKAPNMIKAFVSLMNKSGTAFSVLDDETPSGTFLGDLIGFVEETRTQAKICADQINSLGAKIIIVLDPWEAVTMIQRYGEWGFPINAEIKTAPSFIGELIKQKKLNPAKNSGIVSYHDSSRLARDLEIHDAPRFMLECIGYTVKEMFQNRRLAKCCGSSLLKEYSPDLALLTAEGRWEDFLRTGAETLVTACPQSYELLSQNIPAGKKLADLFELLDSACVS